MVERVRGGGVWCGGKGVGAAREAFRKWSGCVHPDEHGNSPQGREGFKMRNAARAYFDSRAKLNAKRAASQAKT